MLAFVSNKRKLKCRGDGALLFDMHLQESVQVMSREFFCG
jgi:hypothetical protein